MKWVMSAMMSTLVMEKIKMNFYGSVLKYYETEIRVQVGSF